MKIVEAIQRFRFYRQNTRIAHLKLFDSLEFEIR